MNSNETSHAVRTARGTRAARSFARPFVACALALATLFAIAPCVPASRAQNAAAIGARTGAADAQAGAAPTSGQGQPRTGRTAELIEAAPGAGSITGRVVGEDGAPLSQVTVYVWGRNSAPGRAQRGTTTDEEGRFVVNNLPAGLYTVGAQVPGYITEVDPSAGGLGQTFRPGDSATIRMMKGGVITGTVTGPDGEPVVAINVRALRVSSLEGEPTSSAGSFPVAAFFQTDDRGVYRIYGLLPGNYVVATHSGFGASSPYEGDSPTFYPSSTRDTAAEVTVRAGQETAGVDIRYRAERGQRVSGTVDFPADLRDANVGASVSLNYAASGMPTATAFVPPRDSERHFQLEGIADGDYELRASISTPDGVVRTSAPQRVSVRGADVTGLKLTVATLGSISGRLAIEPPADSLRAQELCKDHKPRLLPQEVLIFARREEQTTAARPSQFTRAGSTPDETGAFSLRNLEAGRYRFDVRPLDENLYVRVLQLPSATNATPAARAGAAVRGTTPRTPTTPRRTQGATGTKAPGANSGATAASATGGAASEALALGTGQQVSGVSVRVAFGAALLSGRVVAAAGATTPHARMRVYLVPASTEQAEDVLRYAQTLTDEEGAFVFKNVAPGNYLLVARPNTPAQPAQGDAPLFWTAAGRAALRREAEATRLAADLQPCQRLTDFALALPAQAATLK
jgi:protocatechuate 3,4-dioxygenase beta subunit